MQRLVHAKQRALPVRRAKLSEKRSSRVSGHGDPDSDRGRGRFEESGRNLKSGRKRLLESGFAVAVGKQKRRKQEQKDGGRLERMWPRRERRDILRKPWRRGYAAGG